MVLVLLLRCCAKFLASYLLLLRLPLHVLVGRALLLMLPAVV